MTAPLYKHGARIVALALLLASGGACTDAISPDPDPSRSPSPVASSFDDLARTLFSEPPPGYVVVAEETRGLTLDDVAAGGDDPQAERDRLTRHGFRRGYLRTWASDDESENVVYAFVYEFDESSGAQADARDGIEEAKRQGDTRFDVPGIEGATGLTHTPKAGAETDDATFHAVVFVRANRYYLVAIGGPTDHSTEEAIDLARRMSEAARP